MEEPKRKVGRPRKDLSGKRFGCLTAIKEVDYRKYLCRCDCGKEVVIYRHNLTSGKTTSCGCQRDRKSSERLKELWKSN